MLTIIVLGTESYNEDTQEFIYTENVTLELEHSLVALSKWESKYEKPFLSPDDKSDEDVLGYIKAMTMTPNIAPEVFDRITFSNFKDINEYMNAKMTATWFNEPPHAPRNTEAITAELIYYWLNAFRIPLDVENWHLNRLFTLLKIHNIKNGKPQKMSHRDNAAQRRELNERRKAEMNTKG